MRFNTALMTLCPFCSRVELLLDHISLSLLGSDFWEIVWLISLEIVRCHTRNRRWHQLLRLWRFNSVPGESRYDSRSDRTIPWKNLLFGFCGYIRSYDASLVPVLEWRFHLFQFENLFLLARSRRLLVSGARQCAISSTREDVDLRSLFRRLQFRSPRNNHTRRRDVQSLLVTWTSGCIIRVTTLHQLFQLIGKVLRNNRTKYPPPSSKESFVSSSKTNAKV